MTYSLSTEVGAAAAETRRALLVHNGTASLALLRNTRAGRGLSRLGHGVTLSVALLAAGSTVDALVLDVVLRAAVAGAGAAAVEVALPWSIYEQSGGVGFLLTPRPAPGQLTPPSAWPQTSMTGTWVGKEVFVLVGTLVVFRVVALTWETVSKSLPDGWSAGH